MKLLFLTNIEFILLIFLYENFSQSNAYHLKNKNGAELKKLMSLFKNEKFMDVNREKVDTFLKGISFQSYDDDVDMMECDKNSQLKCPSYSTKCEQDEVTTEWYCKCKPGYQLPRGESDVGNKGPCESKNACDDAQCDEATTVGCVPEGEDDYYCKCKEGFKPKKGDIKKNKDVCVAKTACDEAHCDVTTTYGCVPVGYYDYYCKCKQGFKPKNGDVEKNKDACIETNKCDDGIFNCDKATSKCVPIYDNDYYCKCREGYKPKYGEENENKDACIKQNKCEDGTAKCDKDTTVCTPIGVTDHFCDCNKGYKPKSGVVKKNKQACIPEFKCLPETCPKDSTKCVAKADTYYCECLTGYKLVVGESKDTNQKACLKMDKCEDGTGKCDKETTVCSAIGVTDFYCDCKEGYKPKSGAVEKNKEACIKKNICDYVEDVCPKSSTKCIATKWGSYYCECLPNYDLPEGVKNEENKQACTSGCDSDPCMYGGTCVPKNKNYKCICDPLFFGKNCERVKTKCDDGGCDLKTSRCVLIGDYDYYCRCLEGFKPNKGDVTRNKEACIEEEEECDCGSHSNKCKRNEEGKQICNCFEGYTQYKDICADCYCGQRSLSCSFDDKGHKTCQCFTGYAQRNVTCAAMCKSNSDCLNGGICRYEGNGYFCSCRDNFKGDRCEINDVCDSMMETCDAIGAVCSYNELLRKGFCECPPNRAFNRKLKICEDICKPGSCVHGKCEVVDYHKECRCYEGYTGDDCDRISFKITDKLEWNIGIALLLSAFTCFLIIIFCFLMARQFKTSDSRTPNKMETS